MDMKVEIGWAENNFLLRDIDELVSMHAKEAYIDGDKGILIIIDPDEFLLEELENRGIKFKKVGEG
ncbi:hypothetical protein DRP04_07095 [Archaeoglobales archaeon]|nr:MAG: hypothetical protein DRP04_07095 [Archaeoglobales archaeon]